MADFKFSAYPKPWEIGVSKILILLLPPAQVGTLVYSVWLMCGTPVIWASVGILWALTVAIQFCHNNAKGILEVVKNVNSSGGE